MKSRRVRSLNIKDSSLDKLANLAKDDFDYKIMIAHIDKGDSFDHLEPNSDLRQSRSDCQNLGLYYAENGPLNVKDGLTILIPKKGRRKLLGELHANYLSTHMMGLL